MLDGSDSITYKWHQICSIIFEEKYFSRFGTPIALINDKGSHFYSKQLEFTLAKYSVRHCITTAYHPQSSIQVEVSNCEVK